MPSTSWLDGFRLVAGGLVGGVKFEVHEQPLLEQMFEIIYYHADRAGHMNFPLGSYRIEKSAKSIFQNDLMINSARLRVGVSHCRRRSRFKILAMGGKPIDAVAANGQAYQAG